MAFRDVSAGSEADVMAICNGSNQVNSFAIATSGASSTFSFAWAVGDWVDVHLLYTPA